MKYLPQGTKLYFVIKSLSDRAFSGDPYHYEITSGEIKEVHEFPNRKSEYMVPTRNRLGLGSCLEYPRCSDVGKSCFTTFEEAAAAADAATDNYEKKWSIMLKVPLARPWKTNSKGT